MVRSLGDHSTGQGSLLLGLVTTPSRLQAEEENRPKSDSTVPFTSHYTFIKSSSCTCNGSPPGSFVQGILQARILEWVAMPSSRGSSQPRDRTQVSRIAGGFFTV